MNYKGVSCPVCGQPFQEGDDIVVCPECGAPHHRACYKQLGHCAMEQQLHPQHLSWQNPNDQPPAAAADGSDDIICPNCGLFCHSEDESCPNCHFPLKNKTESQPSNNNQRPVVENPFDEVSGQEQSPDFESMFGAIYENDQIGGFAAKDFIFVIRQNYVYFLRVFKILAQRAKAKVFNWSAFFFGFLYFFYRKMYKIGVLLFGFYILSNVPALVLSFHMLEQTLADPMLMSSLQFDLTGLGGWQIAAQLLMYVRFGVSIYCGFTANRHYYNHCRQKISQLKAASTGGSPNEYYQTLSSVGGASPLPPLLAIAAVIALTLCASIVMALLLGVQ